tara:strand:+ start:57 stop:302 length:246 start_codon:yes stop_codon:yes gene_type:complete
MTEKKVKSIHLNKEIQEYGMESIFVVNTTDNGPTARNAEVVKSVNIIEYEANAKNAEAEVSVNIIDDDMVAKNVRQIKAWR